MIKKASYDILNRRYILVSIPHTFTYGAFVVLRNHESHHHYSILYSCDFYFIKSVFVNLYYEYLVSLRST